MPFEILRDGSDAPLRAFLRSRRADLLHDNDSELDALRRAYTAKFDELCALLAAQYGEDPDPLKHKDARRAEIADEAPGAGRELEGLGFGGENQIRPCSVHIEPQTGVMAGLVPALHVFNSKRQAKKDVDARDKRA